MTIVTKPARRAIWVAAIALSVTGLAGVQNATAATMTCSTAVASLVSNTTACEVSDTAKQDFINQGTVNVEEFFGPADWSYVGKYDVGGGQDNAVSPTLTGSNIAQSGAMNILSSLWNDHGEIMAIFKGGNGFLTGYLLKAGETSFDYASPFLRDGKPTQGISHISLYGRGDGSGNNTSPVPLPAAGWLLIASLGGLAAMGRRRTIS